MTTAPGSPGPQGKQDAPEAQQAPEGAFPGGVSWAHWLVFTLLWLLAMGLVALVRYPEVLVGHQLDADGYMRLVRVELLVDTWGWFDNRIPRNNWPYTDVLHWTRPLDVVIILLALPLAPFIGMAPALNASGSMVSPLLHLASCLALIWVVAPLASRQVRALAAPALLVQPVVLAYGLPGRADHHALITFLFVLAMGTGVRWLCGGGVAEGRAAAGARAERPEGAGGAGGGAGGAAGEPAGAAGEADRWAFLTGAICGLGIWVSPEFLLPLGLFLAAGGVHWILSGRQAVAPNLGLLMGLALALTAAMVLERPPREWLAVEYDRISIAHWTMALVGLGFWLAVTGATWIRDRQEVEDAGPGFRTVGAVVGGLAAAGVMALIHPDFFRGPWISADPEVQQIWLQHDQELQPLVLLGFAGMMQGEFEGLGRAIATVGMALIVIPFAAHRAWAHVRGRAGSGDREHHTGRLVLWGLVALGTLLFALMTLRQARWGVYAGTLMAMGLVSFLDPVRGWIQARAPARRQATLKAAATVLLIPIPLLVGYGLEGVLDPRDEEPDPPASVVDAKGDPGCPIARVASFLSDPELTGHREVTILAHVDRGPEILFRTPHRVLAGPYHRNTRGIVDIHTVFTSDDEDEVHRILSDRRVELILLCPEVDRGFLGTGPETSLFHRLVEGPLPAWATEVEVGEPATPALRLFRVETGAG